MSRARGVLVVMVLAAGSAAAQRPSGPEPESIDVGAGVGLRAGVLDRGDVAENAGLSSSSAAAMLGLSLRANKLLGQSFVAGLSTVGHFHLGGPEGAGLGDWSPVMAHLRFLLASGSNPPRQGFFLELTSGVTLLLLTKTTVTGGTGAAGLPSGVRSIAQPLFGFGLGMGGRWKYVELGGSMMVSGGFQAFAFSFGMQVAFYLPAFPWAAAPEPLPPAAVEEAPVPIAASAPPPVPVAARTDLAEAPVLAEPAEGRFVRPLAPLTYDEEATAGCANARFFIVVELGAPFDGAPAGRQVVLRLEAMPRVSVGQRAAFSGLQRLGRTRDGLGVYCGAGANAEPIAPTVRKGKLLLTCAPIGVVSVDGEQQGTARPSLELELPVGAHQVTCTNPELGEVSATVEVRADETLTRELSY